MRILIVEDDRTSLVYERKILESAGHEVEAAGDGASAMEMVETRPFDVVIMDIVLPWASGAEIARCMRELERSGKLEGVNGRRRLHIIACTGAATEGDKETFAEVGMDDYLAKPVRRASLLAAVDRAAAKINA